MADYMGKGSDLPTGHDETGPIGGGPYPPLNTALDVRDHPSDSGHTATEHHWMEKATRRGGPGPLLKDWSGSFKHEGDE